MTVAVFSDVHGNLEALQAVLEEIARQKVARIICLGDLVGYGADPEACVDQVRTAADAVLAGNHDWAAVGLADPGNFSPLARAALQWTAARLSENAWDFLRSRPLALKEGDTLFAHANPSAPQSWDYVTSPDDGRDELGRTPARLCFVGHSHRAFVCSQTPALPDLLTEGTARVSPGHRCLVNVGSVGQPRDGDARSAFAVWNSETGILRLHRIPYDVHGAQAKIRAARLPEFLADRLTAGR